MASDPVREYGLSAVPSSAEKLIAPAVQRRGTPPAALVSTTPVPRLVHPDTVRDVNHRFPRLRWSGCFVDTLRQEIRLKPWAHSTTLGEEEFPAKILGNPYAVEYE
ncbi:hypothetical protein P170DRAFT_424295 [Aspergillus steynii IBT 23096]|uniref:Uncharacterized protein n=1 Tax=Aspergillus steynii IBT 23096 TaxID=1392250 RepID=A0A2I2GL28_9EURO|nr:uncharacterized protein P170DRAFT_424295 [Aspergillus steynii IBT 23096]PLB53575.1 hypothetical protein P170DRAFT_424295 [Aspergillus steynii IBT 23096]